MRIIESGAFDDIKKTILPKDTKKVEKPKSNANVDVKQEIAAENQRAFSLLDEADTSFELNLDKVEHIKALINEGGYEIVPENIAKGIAYSETTGESNLGLFGQ